MTILLINNNYDEVGLFREALKRVDGTIRLESASDEADAMLYLNGLSPHRPDLIFLSENHFLLLEKLRSLSLHADTPVTIYTNSTNPDDIDRALALNASLFPKPGSYRELILLLRRRFEKMASA